MSNMPCWSSYSGARRDQLTIGLACGKKPFMRTIPIKGMFTERKLLGKVKPRFLDQALGGIAVESIWQLRREFSYALRDTGLVKLNEDIVVPRGRLEELLTFTGKLQKKHNMPVACFGHAGDGNIYVNVMLDDQTIGHEKRRMAVLDELFA